MQGVQDALEEAPGGVGNVCRGQKQEAGGLAIVPAGHVKILKGQLLAPATLYLP